MEFIFKSPLLYTIFLAACTVLILGAQYLFGYKGWKIMGFVLPALLIGCVILFYTKGLLKGTVKDILMPIIGLLVLASSYDRGSTKAKENTKKELEKMKAKDYL